MAGIPAYTRAMLPRFCPALLKPPGQKHEFDRGWHTNRCAPELTHGSIAVRANKTLIKGNVTPFYARLVTLRLLFSLMSVPDEVI
jgi:hypothetical protein